MSALDPSRLRKLVLLLSSEQPGEVRWCTATRCVLWPYRMGTDPFRAPPTEEKRDRGRRLAAGRARPAENQRRRNGKIATAEGGRV